MKNSSKLVLWAAAWMLAACGLSGASDKPDSFYLKDGDRVVFYGDSITDQRLYTTFTETFVLTRFPNLNVSFVHSGWGGDRVTGGKGGDINTRLERDLFHWQPTVVTVMLGMNDGSYRAFDQQIFDTYRNGLTSIVQQIDQRQPGTRVTLIRPSPYDDVTRKPNFAGGYNEVLIRYGDAVEQLAQSTNHQVANLNADLTQVLQSAKGKDATLSTKIIPDRVHPAPAGHWIMAASLLKAWNAPAVVSAVDIDAAAPRVVACENTQVSDLKNENGALVWTQLDKALPMPLNLAAPEFALAVESSDSLNALNRQPLRVAGLTAPYYTLKIDGAEVGVYTAQQLADGLNLAVLPTPMLRQAEKVYELTLRRTGIHQLRWRTLQVPFDQPESAQLKEKLPEILAAFDAEDAAVAALQRAAAQPTSHRYELAPASMRLSTLGDEEPALPEGVGPNLALNKKWQSSSPNTSNWDPGLTDGSWKAERGKTHATGADKKFPKTVTVDLESPQTLSYVLIGVPPFGSTCTVAVSLSEDGQTFKEVGRYTFRQKQEEKRLFPFDPTSARYVRLTYLDNYPEKVGYTNTFMFTTDLQAYGPSAK